MSRMGDSWAKDSWMNTMKMATWSPVFKLVRRKLMAVAANMAAILRLENPSDFVKGENEHKDNDWCREEYNKHSWFRSLMSLIPWARRTDHRRKEKPTSIQDLPSASHQDLGEAHFQVVSWINCQVQQCKAGIDDKQGNFSLLNPLPECDDETFG